MITKEERLAIMQEQNINTEVLAGIISNISKCERTSANNKAQVLQINFAIAIGTASHGATKALYFTKDQLPMVGQWFGVNADSKDESVLAELLTSKLRSGEISRKCEVVYTAHNAGDAFISGDAIDTRKESGFAISSIMTNISDVFSTEIAKENAKVTVAKENTLIAQLKAKKSALKKAVALTDDEQEELSQLEVKASKGSLKPADKKRYDELSAKTLVEA